MDPHHHSWNHNQHLLQEALSEPKSHPGWLELFLDQHAQVHSAAETMPARWSFQDEVLDGLSSDALRAIPSGCEHTIAWILWHLARCEDLTMNLLVAGDEQVYVRQEWKKCLHPPFDHTGNEIDAARLKDFSQTIDIESLKDYRAAVGASTRRVVSQLDPVYLQQKVDPDRILRVRRSGDVLPAAEGIINYWSKRTVAGLLLMPPTRHCFIHLNEASRIRQVMSRKPNPSIL